MDGQAIMEPFVERLYLTKGVYREKMESHQYKNKVIQSKTIEIHLYSCVKNLGNLDRIRNDQGFPNSSWKIHHQLAIFRDEFGKP